MYAFGKEEGRSNMLQRWKRAWLVYCKGRTINKGGFMLFKGPFTTPEAQTNKEW